MTHFSLRHLLISLSVHPILSMGMILITRIFEGRKEFLCYMEYFESILENISAYDGFDVYGHIDYVVRYGPNRNREYSYGRYKDILDEILKKLISMEKASNLIQADIIMVLENPIHVLP